MAKTITFTDRELGELVRAVEVHLDITDDTILEDLNLYPEADETISFNRESAKKLRDAISDKIDQLDVVRSLARKVGVVIVDK